MTRLQINLLGKPEIIHDGQAVSFRTRKALALLIYLVVEGGTHSRAKLATLFWPESDSSSGRATLRSTLRYLRKPLEHPSGSNAVPHLNVTRDALSFNVDSDYELDLDVVQRALDDQSPTPNLQSPISVLQSAVATHRGYFLEGFSLPDAPEFDDWAGFQREQWHLRLGEAFARLSQIQARAGDTAAAIETTARWVAFQPLKEAAYRRLMRLQLADGDRPGALQTYQTCRETLAEELDVEPAPETRALAQRVKGARLPEQRDGQDSPSAAGNATEDTFAVPQAQSPFPFVGRRRQHTRLVEAFYRSEDGHAQAAIVQGEAGIGKTRLAQEFLGWAAAQGAEVGRGRAFETGGRLPYQPVVTALRPLVPRLAELLAPTWLGELARILPELNERLPDLPPPTTDETLGRSRLFEAVAHLGMALPGRAPFVFFLDDLQWADAATLDLLTYAVRRWHEQEAPILLLGAVRAEALHRAAASDGLLEWVRDLEREPGLLRLELEALSQREIDYFVERAAHPDEDPARVAAFGRWLFRETRGQPFYLTETIKALREDGVLVPRPGASGQSRLAFSSQVTRSVSWDQPHPLQDFIPPGVRDVVRDRLARLTPAAFDLLVAGAILGQEFDFRAVCRVAGLPRNEALPVLDTLLGTRLLAEATQANRPYTFAHDKIRDVVYTEAGDARRQLFHERALTYLKETHAPAAQLAHHAYRAEAYEAAFRHSVQAGDDAMDVFAVQDAIFHFERAHRTLVENPHIGKGVKATRRLYERLGRAYELVNEWESAQSVYEEMLATARDGERLEMEVAALNRLATTKLLWQLDPEGALSILEEARVVAEAGGDRRGLAEAEWGLCMSRFYGFDRRAALDHGKRAVALAREIGDRALIAKCLNATGYAASGVNLWHKVEAYGDEAHTLYAKMDDRALEVDSLLLVAFARTNTGRAASAVAVARGALQISREIENEWGEANARNHLAAGLLDAGAYGEAFDTVQKVFALPQLEDAPQIMAAFTVRGMVYRALQDFERALADHLKAEDYFHRLSSPGMIRVLSAHHCADYAYLGQWEKAYERAQVAMQTKDFGWYYAGFHYWTVTEALLRGGDEAAATDDVETLAEAVEQFPRYKIVVERSRAALTKWRGEITETIAHLKTALEQADALSLPGQQWPLLAELGQLHQRSGHEEAAQAAFARAAEIARGLAATVDDRTLRDRFLASETVQALLEE